MSSPYRLSESMRDKAYGLGKLKNIAARLGFNLLESCDLMTEGNYEAQRGLKDLPSVSLRSLRRPVLALTTVGFLGIALATGTSHTSPQYSGTYESDSVSAQESFVWDEPPQEIDPSLEARAEILGYESGVGGAEAYFSNTLQPDSWGQTSRSGITSTASGTYQFLDEKILILPPIKIKWRRQLPRENTTYGKLWQELTYDTLSHSKFKKCTDKEDLMLLNPPGIPTYEGPKMYPGRAFEPTSNNF